MGEHDMASCYTVRSFYFYILFDEIDLITCWRTALAARGDRVNPVIGRYCPIYLVTTSGFAITAA
jgi:hypothetical protein